MASGLSESIPNTPNECYNIGKSQHRPINLITFIQRNSDDPAAKVRKIDSFILAMIEQSE